MYANAATGQCLFADGAGKVSTSPCDFGRANYGQKWYLTDVFGYDTPLFKTSWACVLTTFKNPYTRTPAGTTRLRPGR